MEVLLSFVQYGAIFLLLAAVSILGTVAGIILWKKKNAGASTKRKGIFCGGFEERTIDFGGRDVEEIWSE